MENLETEDSNIDIKEKVPVSGKKHPLLQWKLNKDQLRKKKPDGDELEEIPCEKFEHEARKMCKKYSQYTQRKEQEKSKVSSTSGSEANEPSPKVNVRRINVQTCNPEEEPHDQIWIDCDDENNVPRPAVASLNLTKNTKKITRQLRMRRSKEVKRNRPTRESRAKGNKRYEEYFLDESESEEDDDIDEDGEFSLTKELSLSSGKPLKRWQKRNNENDKQSHVDNDEQPESDIAKWVFDVLSISKVKNSPPICRPKLTSSPPIPRQPEKKNSEDHLKLNVSQDSEEALMEFNLVGPDSESKAFTGLAAQIPASNVIETLPNMVPRNQPKKRPIRHSHCITNEPISDEEELEPDSIMGITTRLLGKAIRTSSCKKTEVKPFCCIETVKRDLRDDYLDEAPDRWLEDPINDYDTLLATMRI